MVDSGLRRVIVGSALAVAFSACADEPSGGPQTGGTSHQAAGSEAVGTSAAGSGGGGTNAASSGGGGTNAAGSGGASGASIAGASGAEQPGGMTGSGGVEGDGGAGWQGGSGALDCGPSAGFVGELAGIFTTDAERVDYGDANLQGVVAAYPQFDAVWEVDVDVHDAVITATAAATPGPGVSASKTDFWIADDNVLLAVALDPELGASCCPDFELRAGMRVSFNVSEVSLFAGLGRITAASGFVAGTQGNCVLVAEPEKIEDVDFYQPIRVSGQLSGEPYSSDDGSNWQLGLSDAVLYDLLTQRANLQVGQTVTFVGPVSPYVGFHRLVEYNSAWIEVD